MNLADIQLLYEYHYWANKQILSACQKITPEQYAAAVIPDPGNGSLRSTLVHMLDTDYGWRVLLQGGGATPLLTADELSTLADLVTHWQADEQAMRSYLNSVSDQALNGVVRYTTSAGVQRERVLWHCLLHVANHGTQHRSEAAAMLTGYGQSPGELDFLYFLLEVQ